MMRNDSISAFDPHHPIELGGRGRLEVIGDVMDRLIRDMLIAEPIAGAPAIALQRFFDGCVEPDRHTRDVEFVRKMGGI